MEPKVRILILFAHPAFEKSRVNRRLVEAVRNLDGVTFHDLYEAYPDFYIDVQREQLLLLENDLLVLHHPFLWYSTPALVKEWEDLVLEHGWAYGSGGTALTGKRVLSVITAGGSRETYCRQGYNRFTMRELLAPLAQTARLCGMDYLAPFVVFGTHAMTDADIERHAADYRRGIEALRDGRIDPGAAQDCELLNDRLDGLIES